MAVGFTDSFGAGEGDVWVLKLDSSGGISWQKTYGGIAHDGGYDIHQTADGGYAVAGITYSYGVGGDKDFWVIKLDPQGNIIWDNTYDGSKNESAKSI